MQNIKINNALDLCVIDIEGAIGIAEEWQFENAGERVATYEKFRECVARIEALEAERVVVNIRSTGGDVNDAMLIYEALISLGIPITTRCYGYVASAATVIAQAASEGERLISPNALYLVHNSTCVAEGNVADLESKVELLRKTDERLSELYARRSGRTAEEFKTLMDQEGGNGHWLSADEAIEAGLADKLIDNSTEGEGDNTSIKNFWRKLGERLGLKGEDKPSLDEELPQANHAVLHSTPEQTLEREAATLFDEGQRSAKPTTLKAVEDPSLMEVTPTRNQQAYTTDVKAFK